MERTIEPCQLIMLYKHRRQDERQPLTYGGITDSQMSTGGQWASSLEFRWYDGLGNDMRMICHIHFDINKLSEIFVIVRHQLHCLLSFNKFDRNIGLAQNTQNRILPG